MNEEPTTISKSGVRERTTMRLPKALMVSLRTQARLERRSLANLVEIMLDESLKKRKRSS